MTVTVTFGEATDTVGADSLFIQGDDLASFVASDFANAETDADKKARLFYGILLTMENYDFTNVLGMNVTAGTLAGQSSTVVNKTITFTYQKYLDTNTGTVGALLVPTIGANTGVGEVALTDIFTNAAILTSGANYPANGAAIALDDLDPFTQVTLASFDPANDSREVINALMKSLSTNIDIRTADVSTSITATTTNADAILILPAVATDNTDPTTGFTTEDLNNHTFLERTDTFTYSVSLDLTNKTAGVNIATL